MLSVMSFALAELHFELQLRCLYYLQVAVLSVFVCVAGQEWSPPIDT